MDQCEDSIIARGFPNELRVLAVDDDVLSLKLLERLLLECGYKVTVARHAHDALKLLRENKDVYDLVISDVNMPDMDGFKLLEIVGLEMDLPVIMLSVDCDFKSVMKGIMHGAVDYIVKPIRLEEIKVIWKHVARKSLKELKGPNDPKNKVDHGRIAVTAQDVNDSQLIKKLKSQGKEKDYDDNTESDEEATAQKKPRVTWTADLHSEFIKAVNQLGLDRAVPKKILDIMNIPGLSRENVASHLQKYRRGLKRNGMGLSEHFETDAGTSGYTGSLDFGALNSRCTSINFENFGVNGCKFTRAPSAYLSAQQSHNGHSVVSPTWFTRPFSRQNDLGLKFTINTHSSQLVTGRTSSNNPQTDQLVTATRGLITNSVAMNTPSQASSDLSYRSFNPRSNQLNSYTQTCRIPSPPDEDSCLNSVRQLGYVVEAELKQQQFSACSGVDVEMEALINSNINENLNQRSPFDFTIVPENFSQEIISSLNNFEYEDDLHAALKQVSNMPQL